MLIAVRSSLLLCALVLQAIPSLSLAAEDSALPRPEEIGEANDAAWDSLAILDVTYIVRTKSVKDGKPVLQRVSEESRWIRTPTHQRLLLRNMDGKQQIVDRLVGGNHIKTLQYPTDIDLVAAPLRPCDSRPIRARIDVWVPGSLDELCPQNMEYLYFTRSSPRVRLSQLLSEWKVDSIESAQGNPKDDRMVVVKVAYPASDSKFAGSYATLTVNCNKMWLVEKAEIIEQNAARSTEDSSPVAVRTKWEVLEWAEIDAGVWYPSRVSFSNTGQADMTESQDGYFIEWISKTAVANSPDLIGTELGFQFPENAIVSEFDSKRDQQGIMIWGPNNTPHIEFVSEDEYEVYRRELCNVPQVPATKETQVADSSVQTSYFWWIVISNAFLLAVVIFFLKKKSR